jgi:2-amino-4-hydroxy-6-hydroxymethyldihydropteridine diphosphokinase
MVTSVVSVTVSPVVVTKSNVSIAAKPWSRRMHIGLGANLGKAEASIREAIGLLAAWANQHEAEAGFKHSRLYRSTAIGGPGPDYVNAVAEFYSALSAEEVLSALQAIENSFGRVRPYPNAPRTLDLDLLLIDGENIQLPHLIVPHPRITERAFVLKPLAELQPSLILGGQEISQWIGRTEGQCCEAIAEPI